MATDEDPIGFEEPATGARLCLNMIVRNEMANLDRCLRAVADHVACWVIGDTGSSDGTPDFVRSFFNERGIPGELHAFPFLNFEQARNEALARAYDSPLEFDYLLLVDADMELVVEDARFRSGLTAPGYMLIQRAGIVYWNTRLVRRDAQARYRGVTHEYVDVPGGTQTLQGAWFIDHATGSNRVVKFERDISLLLGGLEQEPENARYWFYLAQSYRDAGRLREALDAYAKRAEMGGWIEEVFESLYAAGHIKEQLGYPDAEIIGTHLKAYDARPGRAESLHAAAHYCRNHGMHRLGYMIGKTALAIPQPSDGLFVVPWIYEYGALDEFSVNAYWAGHYEESLEACDRLLREAKFPADTRERIEKNRDFARKKIAERHLPATAPQPAIRARPAPSAAPVFLHSSWRTSSTWFWSRFRAAAGTLCYFEPFNELLATLTRDQALAWDYKWWNSGHPPGDPYCLEYLPLIRRAGGVRLFEKSIPNDWFVPLGGLQGELRSAELRYLALLLRHAARAGKMPVLGFTNSLARIAAIKSRFGGVHIFQYRDLWRQWASYLTYRRRNIPFFYESVARLVDRDDDPYLSGLRDRYLERTKASGGPDTRGAAAKRLLSLSEHETFEMFMGLHLYLYLYAGIAADMSVDVTRMARDRDYRSRTEEALRERTGVPVSLADIDETPGAPLTGFDTAAIDWARIRDHARAAAKTLGRTGDEKELTRTAGEFIDAAIGESERQNGHNRS